MATPKSVSFHTLGCKLNFTETSSIRRQFEDAGYFVNKFDETSDIYVINTCSVTDFADKKCRKAVRKAVELNKEARIIIIGCYAQLKPKEIAEIPGVDLVLGAAEKFDILNYVDSQAASTDKGMVIAGEVSSVNQFIPTFSFGDRTRSFLKVQDGCDYKCSFCTIPQARGRSRSNSIENILDNVRLLEEKGAKEIVLTGINLGDYKYDSTQSFLHFLDLIKVLDRETNISRYRISSIEPNLCSDEIIEFVAKSEKFMPHFHMPLQSGSDKILRAMRRRYKSDLYKNRVTYIKDRMPHACIGVDVIVGFPGESEEDFMETHAFLNNLPVSYFHVFTFSERNNTLAATLPGVVDMNTRRDRNALLSILSQKKKRAFYQENLKSSRPVLFEKSKLPGFVSGFTDNYIKVSLTNEGEIVNTIQDVILDSLSADLTFRGSIIKEAIGHGTQE